MDCQIVLFISLIAVAPTMAEMLRPTMNPSPSNQPFQPTNQAIIFITPRQPEKSVIELKETQAFQAYDDYRRRQYSTNMPNIQVPLSSTEQDVNEFKNLFFKAVNSKNGKEILEPIQVFLKPTQQAQTQNNHYTSSNPNNPSTLQSKAPTNLLNPGASKRDTPKKDTQSQQKYQLIPYEFDTQGGILREGPAILNSAFEIIIAPQKESIHQNQKEFYHVDNYFDFETVAKEREKARMKAEIIAKSPPVLVQSSINISRKIPTGIIKTIKVPIPLPYFVPVSERYPVPQPYIVPFEIVRPFIVPFTKTEKIEVERPVPVEVEKHVHSPVEKKVFLKLERPYPGDKVVPGEVKREVPYEAPNYRYSVVKHVYDH